MWLIIMGILSFLVGAYIIKLSFEEGRIFLIGLYLGGMALILAVAITILGVQFL